MQNKPKMTDAVRYFDAPQLDRDLEARLQAEFEAKRTASRFLAEGPNGNRPTLADIPTVAPIRVPVSEVSDITSQILRKNADACGTAIAQGLRPYNFEVRKGDPTVSTPFEKAPHLKETEACRIKIVNPDGSHGLIVVKVTNFNKGHAVVTPSGLRYDGVKPELMTKNERPACRVLGFHADENGKILSVDPALTNKGVAWTTGSVKEIVDKVARSAINAQKQQAVTAKKDSRPMPTPSGRFSTQPADRKPSSGMKF
ncbi:hypothetical protein G8E10_24960 [Rhizobiaceae bacterium CRRU44]|uniref:Uncharacterized protein n=1 Tax=Ferranicluibacter rubi TaxID=2715133 RepID=A0AA43ZJA1_9HYPH|nr:hypothetical protein [Ferranicluibacter rubi]NHT78954.1 hypothetical protein [Ferranicluibacter rubi]